VLMQAGVGVCVRCRRIPITYLKLCVCEATHEEPAWPTPEHSPHNKGLLLA